MKGCFINGTFTTRNLAPNDIKKIVDEVNKISHKEFGKDRDLIGYVYEYFLKEFAVNATKEEGEFYTPHDVVQLIATMIEPYNGTLYDPCCGSGGMFVQSAALVKSKQGNLNSINVYGQEKEPATYRLAKMNLALRGISHNLGSEADSSFTHDLHEGLRFNYIMATSEVDTDTMNRAVSKMVEEALRYNQVESVLESGEEEDIFSPEYFEKLSDVKMPATKLELLIKMLRKQINEFSKVNQLAAKTFQEMLEKTIAEYHERRKHLTAEEAGETQNIASDDIIRAATEQALDILRQMNENRESFRKLGLTFEEKAFYDILISLRDRYNFEYGTDKKVDGIVVNEKCKYLAKKVKEIIDDESSYADWLNNQNVRDQLKLRIKICLVKNGYPPQYSPEVFNKVMEQVENFEENY